MTMNYQMKLAVLKSFIIAFTCQLAMLAAQSQAVPKPTGLVNDYSKPQTLSSEEIAKLTAKLRAYEDSTSTQIAICIENSSNGVTPVLRTTEIGRAWGIGQEGKDNGVIIYLAIKDRKFHISSGNRTQGELTNGIIGQIGRDDLVPYLKNQNYYEGLDQTTSAIMKMLAGKYKADPRKKKGLPSWAVLLIILAIILFVSSGKGGGGQRGFRRTGPYWYPAGGSNWGGGGFNGGGGGSSCGCFGGGGGFNGGGAGGSW